MTAGETLEISLRIDWSDLDYYAHVNNVSIARYLQSARVNFWELSGLAESYQEFQKGPMLVGTKSDFKNALTYPGVVRIVSRIIKIGNSSFSIAHQLYDSHNILCVESVDTAVCYDFKHHHTIPIPETIRKVMERYS
ncbi:MAG TPA: thioesterase family protein [Flavobacteriaceae bacterium]|nr:thioesterase family protein [Flavobacteriaceae bacterium]